MNAFISEVMQHLAGLQAVADSNAAKQARQAVAASEIESLGHPPNSLAVSCVLAGKGDVIKVDELMHAVKTQIAIPPLGR